ncbi:unnamed protein product, partial [Discosporangium mesarthrocarpum]
AKGAGGHSEVEGVFHQGARQRVRGGSYDGSREGWGRGGGYPPRSPTLVEGCLFQHRGPSLSPGPARHRWHSEPRRVTVSVDQCKTRTPWAGGFLTGVSSRRSLSDPRQQEGRGPEEEKERGREQGRISPPSEAQRSMVLATPLWAMESLWSDENENSRGQGAATAVPEPGAAAAEQRGASTGEEAVEKRGGIKSSLAPLQIQQAEGSVGGARAGPQEGSRAAGRPPPRQSTPTCPTTGRNGRGRRLFERGHSLSAKKFNSSCTSTTTWVPLSKLGPAHDGKPVPPGGGDVGGEEGPLTPSSPQNVPQTTTVVPKATGAQRAGKDLNHREHSSRTQGQDWKGALTMGLESSDSSTGGSSVVSRPGGKPSLTIPTPSTGRRSLSTPRLSSPAPSPLRGSSKDILALAAPKAPPSTTIAAGAGARGRAGAGARGRAGAVGQQPMQQGVAVAEGLGTSLDPVKAAVAGAASHSMLVKRFNSSPPSTTTWVPLSKLGPSHDGKPVPPGGGDVGGEEGPLTLSLQNVPQTTTVVPRVTGPWRADEDLYHQEHSSRTQGQDWKGVLTMGLESSDSSTGGSSVASRPGGKPSLTIPAPSTGRRSLSTPRLSSPAPSPLRGSSKDILALAAPKVSPSTTIAVGAGARGRARAGARGRARTVGQQPMQQGVAVAEGLGASLDPAEAAAARVASVEAVAAQRERDLQALATAEKRIALLERRLHHLHNGALTPCSDPMAAMGVGSHPAIPLPQLLSSPSASSSRGGGSDGKGENHTLLDDREDRWSSNESRGGGSQVLWDLKKKPIEGKDATVNAAIAETATGGATGGCQAEEGATRMGMGGISGTMSRDKGGAGSVSGPGDTATDRAATDALPALFAGGARQAANGGSGCGTPHSGMSPSIRAAASTALWPTNLLTEQGTDPASPSMGGSGGGAVPQGIQTQTSPGSGRKDDASRPPPKHPPAIMQDMVFVVGGRRGHTKEVDVIDINGTELPVLNQVTHSDHQGPPASGGGAAAEGGDPRPSPVLKAVGGLVVGSCTGGGVRATPRPESDGAPGSGVASSAPGLGKGARAPSFGGEHNLVEEILTYKGEQGTGE